MVVARNDPLPEEQVKNAQAALTWLDSRSPDPRLAALGRLRKHLKNHPTLLADLDVVSSLTTQKES